MSSRSRLLESFVGLQDNLLRRVSREPAHEILDDLCAHIGRLVDSSNCAVMLLGTDGKLYFGSQPCLPDDVGDQLGEQVPERLATSCGAAVRSRQVVLVPDTLADANWVPLRDLAQALSIHSCWSVPIFGSADIGNSSEVLGAFAISRGVLGLPDEEQLGILHAAGKLAGIAIERGRVEQRTRDHQHLLRAVLEGTEDPIFAKDLDGYYLLANTATSAGVCEEPAQMIGRTDDELYPPHLAVQFIATDRDVIESGASQLFEAEAETPAVGRRRFLIRKSPLLDDDGQPAGVIGIARDISALRTAEDRAARLKRNESLGLLAGGIAHDFNGLLTGILGNSDYLLETAPQESSLRRRLEDIRHAAVRATDLTDQMLALAGHKEIDREPAPVRDILTEAHQLIESDVPVRLDFESDSLHFHGDASQLLRVFLNLFRNAVEAMAGRAGEVVVQATTAPDMSWGGELRLERAIQVTVEDTGHGMDAETADRVFDPFFSTKRRGRGLGLAVVEGIVRSHDGRIEVSSTLGGGTKFTAWLPATDAPQRSPDPIQAPGAPITSGTVLVVDDEELIRSLAQIILEEDGHRVLLASDGDTAMLRLEQEPSIDLVLLDLTLPDISGHQVLANIREHHADLPVILSSGYNAEEALAGGAQDEVPFLKKPYRSGELRRRIRKALTERLPGTGSS